MVNWRFEHGTRRITMKYIEWLMEYAIFIKYGVFFVSGKNGVARSHHPHNIPLFHVIFIGYTNEHYYI